MARKKDDTFVDTEVALSGPARFEALPPADGTLKVSKPLSPDASVRLAHAALLDAIGQARVAGYVVTGDLDRIAISATAKAR